MELAIYYHYIYLLVISIAIVFSSQRYSFNSIHLKPNVGKEYLFVLIVIFFIGLRPFNGKEFIDMGNYIQFYKTFYEGVPFSFDFYAENWLFDNLFAWWGSMRLGYTSFFLFISFVYFGVCYYGIKRLFPRDCFAVFLVFLSAFSTFSYATNGIKAGAAASVYILALSFRNKLLFSSLLLFFSWGIHHSMIVPIFAYFLSFTFRNPKWFYYGWFLCLLLAVLKVSYFQNLFSNMGDDKAQEYLSSSGAEWGGKTGFRYDFVLYSSVPVIIGYIIEMKRKIPVSESYSFLIHIYLCTNGVWMLCMYANFTNRIAYLSWLLYPIVLAYPFLNEDISDNRYFLFSKVMRYHLAFTLLMVLIFYGGLVKLIGI